MTDYALDPRHDALDGHCYNGCPCLVDHENESLWRYLDCDGEQRSGSDIPTRRTPAVHPPQEPEPEDDGLGAARGVILAIPIGIAVWLAVYACLKIAGCL